MLTSKAQSILLILICDFVILDQQFVSFLDVHIFEPFLLKHNVTCKVDSCSFLGVYLDSVFFFVIHFNQLELVELNSPLLRGWMIL